MTPEQPRTDANSRERSPDHQYTLSVEQAADLYAKAGHPRTTRAIQKYCALSKLDCHKVETETGEKYLVAPYSVDRHIAYIKKVRTVANGRDQTRTDANVRTMENKGERATNTNEQSRTDAALRGPEDRYVGLLEKENEFLRGQVTVKDSQIEALLERDKETNTLIHRLQAMLAPLLVAPGIDATPPRRQTEQRHHPPLHKATKPAEPSNIRDVNFAREQSRTVANVRPANHPADFLHSVRRTLGFIARYNSETYDGNR